MAGDGTPPRRTSPRAQRATQPSPPPSVDEIEESPQVPQTPQTPQTPQPDGGEASASQSVSTRGPGAFAVTHRRELGVSPVRLASTRTSPASARRGVDVPETPGGDSVANTPTDLTPVDIGGESATAADESFLDAIGTPSQETENQRVIWGTKINIEDAIAAFTEFLTTFRTKKDGVNESNNEEKALYMQILEHIQDVGSSTLNVDMAHLRAHAETWYQSLVSYPETLIPVFDQVATDVFAEMFPQAGQAIAERQREAISVRCYNLSDTDLHAMRSISPHHITSMVAVRGMVIRASPLIPDLQRALYRCSNAQCSAKEVEVAIQDGRIQEPTKCATCGARNSYQLLHSRSGFSDRQMMRLQEAPEAVPNGETPATFSLVMYDSMVDSAKPGDRVEVTGILRASPVRVNPKMRTVKSVFRTYIDCIHMAVLNNNNSRFRGNPGVSALATVDASKDNDDDPTDEQAEDEDSADIDGSVSRDTYTPAQKRARERYFYELSCHPYLYRRLSESLAPSIFGMSDEKKGVLLQLFGGASKVGVGEATGHDSTTGAARFRSSINILLVGDPGTSKSQLLHSAHRLAPRGVYTSGRGSSAVGLTAYVTRDPDTNDFVLESGALVLSDRGVCCIDEFDKMSDFARSVLHEAMEQQTVSIAKAGIIATLNARTAVLAAANPVDSRYDPRKSVVENIDLPPTLLSRFDLIYLVLDAPNAEADRRLASHIVSLFFKNYKEKPVRRGDVTSAAPASDADEDGAENDTDTPEGATGVHYAGEERPSALNLLDADTLTEYIAYARATVDPKISSEAADALVSGYLQMRSEGRGGATISATPRQLESLIRLAEAHARMHLREHVTDDDVAEAIRLVREAMKTAALDPATGKINMDLFAAGATATATAGAHAQALMVAVLDCLRAVGSATDTGMQVSQLIAKLRESSDTDITAGDLRDVLRELEADDKVVVTGGGSTVRLIAA